MIYNSGLGSARPGSIKTVGLCGGKAALYHQASSFVLSYSAHHLRHRSESEWGSTQRSSSECVCVGGGGNDSLCWKVGTTAPDFLLCEIRHLQT